MAQAETVKGDTKKNGATDSVPEGFTELVDNRTSFKPNVAGMEGVTLRGLLVNLQEMPPAATGPWSAFTIVATAPTKGVDRDGKIVDVKVGEEIIIANTAGLADLIDKARKIDGVHEVILKATGKRDTKNGKMTTFKILVSNALKPRTGLYSLSESVPMAQLTAGESGAVGADEFP
jgi:hypothetical protein